MDGDRAAAQPEQKLRLFLSYSRKDTEFVRRLADALTGRGYLADFDQSTHHAETGNTGIAPTDDWWVRLQDMIAAADVMVLCVSPDSAASKVVDEEIAYARSLSKRIVAITCREVDFNTAPPRLSALNVSHWFLRLRIKPGYADPAAQACSFHSRIAEELFEEIHSGRAQHIAAEQPQAFNGAKDDVAAQRVTRKADQTIRAFANDHGAFRISRLTP